MFKDELDEASKREENEQIDLQQYIKYCEWGVKNNH